MRMRMDAHGMNGLVVKQLEDVTWKCWNMHMRMDVHGMNTLVLLQPEEVTWTC